MIINVKNTPELSELPLRATPKSAAYDVFAVAEPEIVGEKDGECWKRIDYIQYRTSLHHAPQKDVHGTDYHVLIHPRSSASKYNLLLANGIGLIDSDYRGEYLVRYKYVFQPEDLVWGGETIRGIVNTDKIYKKGDRIAQLVVEPTTEAEWVRVENLDETIRGTGGFESTGRSIPVGQSSTTIKISQESGIKEKPVDHEKNYESKVDLIDQWKKAGGNQEPASNISYEKLIKEREKQLGNPK